MNAIQHGDSATLIQSEVVPCLRQTRPSVAVLPESTRKLRPRTRLELLVLARGCWFFYDLTLGSASAICSALSSCSIFASLNSPT